MHAFIYNCQIHYVYTCIGISTPSTSFGRDQILGLYSDGRLTTWTRESSMPHDSNLDVFNRSGIWQAPRQRRWRNACQIAERYGHRNSQSRGFDTSPLEPIFYPNIQRGIYRYIKGNVYSYTFKIVRCVELVFLHQYIHWVYGECVNTEYDTMWNDYLSNSRNSNLSNSSFIVEPIRKTLVMYSDFIDKEQVTWNIVCNMFFHPWYIVWN